MSGGQVAQAQLSGARAIGLVARREITERVRDRSFVVGIVFTVLFIAAFVLGPRLLGFGDPEEYTLGVVDDEGAALAAAAAAAAARGDEVVVDVERFDGPAAGEAAVRDGDVIALVTAGELLVDEELPPELGALVQGASGQVRAVEELGRAGVPAAEAVALLNPDPLPVRALDPPPEGGGRAAGSGVAFFVLFVLYGQIFGYGIAVASGIVEEKSTRVVEVVLASIRPVHLLAGKVLGIGVVGLLQLITIAVVGVALVAATGAVDLPPGTFSAVSLAIAWFLLGYAFYACAFAVVGALVSRQEELQNASTPLTLVVFAALGLSSAAIADPSSLLARVGSFLPPTAPLVMPMRMTLGAVEAWEVLVAVALMVVAIAAVVLLAARVYQAGALRTGQRIRLRQALDTP